MMVSDVLTPMNHREIEYNAKKLSGCDIPDGFLYSDRCEETVSQRQNPHDCEDTLLKWLDETGKRVFDSDLVMDYGTDCLRLYLLFEKTPKEKDAPYYDSWQEGALEGIYKFLGRYRRMILAVDAWNRQGNYKEETLLKERIGKLGHALEDTDSRIKEYIRRGNTMANRHNIVSAMMELLNLYQKELRIGEIVTSFHVHAVETAVPHGSTEPVINMGQVDMRNSAVTDLCKNFIILMKPYAPDLSKILWNYIK